MQRLRVVFSIGAMHGGGSERQLVSLLRNLDRQRFEPFLYLVYRSGPLLPLIPEDVPVAAFAERVRTPRLYLPGRLHRLRVRDYSRFLQEVRADVSYDRTFLMTLISAAGAQQIGVPNVSTIVTNPETGFAPVAGRFQWLKRRLLHRLYNQSACVLAVSDGARQAAIRFYGIQPDRIRTLPNGVDTALLLLQAQQPVPDPWWTAAPAGCLKIVTAGRLNEHKGFHLLIDAVAELKQQRPARPLRLAILGEGSWRARLEAQIAARGLTAEVRLPGFQPEAAAWYRGADVFVLPSLIEGMPNVLLEAMALGVPVISTDCPSGPREILQSGQLGRLVPVASAPALTAALLEFADQPAAASQLAEAAVTAVHNTHSIAAACRRLEQIFTEVSQRRPAP